MHKGPAGPAPADPSTLPRGECARICPVDCIELSPGPRIGGGCVYWYACRERCPSGAMLLATPCYARRSLRKRTARLPLRHLSAPIRWR